MRPKLKGNNMSFITRDVPDPCFSGTQFSHPGTTLVTLTCLLFVFFCPPVAGSESGAHLRLVDPLDRLVDGYCVDIHGTPGYLRTDLPLFAHNCKREPGVDSTVQHDPRGFIRFVGVDLCITVAGVNSKALPGAAIILQKCGENTAFMETTALQMFNLRSNGHLELGDTGLCVTVGEESATTYSDADSWRPLFVANCKSTDPARTRWQFVTP